MAVLQAQAGQLVGEQFTCFSQLPLNLLLLGGSLGCVEGGLQITYLGAAGGNRVDAFQ